MAQLHFTLDSDFFVGLFSETKDEAFGKLMEALLNQVLQAESTEQLGAIEHLKKVYELLKEIGRAHV